MTAIAGTDIGPRRVADPKGRAALPAPVLFATAASPAALTVDVRWETPAGHPLVAPPVLAVVHGTYGHTLAPGRPVPGQRHDDQPAPGVRHEQVRGDGHPVAVAARVCVQPAELARGTERVLLLLETGAGAVRVRAESELTAEPVVGAVPVHTSPAVLLAELIRGEQGWGVRVVGRGLPDGVEGLLRGLGA